MCIASNFIKFITRPKSRPIIAVKGFHRTNGRLRATNLMQLFYRVGAQYGPAGHRTKKGDKRLDKYSMSTYGDMGFHANTIWPEYGNITRKVVLWGLIAVHRRGYRAEFFKILPIKTTKKPHKVVGTRLVAQR